MKRTGPIARGNGKELWKGRLFPPTGPDAQTDLINGLPWARRSPLGLPVGWEDSFLSGFPPGPVHPQRIESNVETDSIKRKRSSSLSGLVQVSAPKLLSLPEKWP